METPHPVPPTPRRPLNNDDFFDEENNEIQPKIQVKDITDQFKAHGLFGFDGSTKYQEGKHFLQRFEGAIRTHPHSGFKQSLTEDQVPPEWLLIIFQALVMLTTGAAASTVYNYPDDGIQALKALRRELER